MSVSVCCSLAHVEQGRSTCNVSRSLSVELFCFAACVCHVCLFRFLARSLTSSKDDRPAMSIAISPSSFFASQRVPVTAPDRREFCRSLANSLAKSIKNHGENRSRETPRGTQNRLKIGPGTLSGHPVASKSVPKASRERLGSVPERPRRAAGASGGMPRMPRDARKGALEGLGACRGDQN